MKKKNKDGGNLHLKSGENWKSMKNGIYSPIWSNGENLPRDRATINAWCRSFYALNPYVNTSINFLSTFPIMFLEAENPHAIPMYLGDISLEDKLIEILKEYFIVGEAIVYSELDEKDARWGRLIIQNPDYVIIKKSITSDQCDISLRPDERLRSLIKKDPKQQTEDDKKTINSISEEVVKAVLDGKNIELNNFYTSHLCAKLSPYDVRGTSIILPVINLLRYLDSINNIINFTESDTKHLIESRKEVEKQINVSLMNPAYLNNGLQKDILLNNTNILMNMITTWLERKIFAPIAKIQDRYEFKNGEKILFTPKISFNSKKYIKKIEDLYDAE
jgi:hypothetical protein